MQFSLLDSKMNGTWSGMNSHPPHLSDVATPPCESQNTENVTLQPDRPITEENYTRCVIASWNWTRVIMCLKLTVLILGVVQQCVHETDSRHRRPAKTLDANLVWLWLGRRRRCNWPVAWSSEIMSGGHFEHMHWHECLLPFAWFVDDTPVCLSVPRRIPTLLHGPGCNMGMVGVPPICALLGGFAIGAHDSIAANTKCQRVLCTRSMPERFMKLSM